MKTIWDYTALADAYLKRPDYAEAAVDALLAVAAVEAGDPVCDLGAGVAHLTRMLAVRGLHVAAVEPNDAMRAHGRARTVEWPEVNWFEGTGENSGQPDAAFVLATFGSSFNVCDRLAALAETARILKPHGWFACLWNHRDLTDPLQAEIEATIRARVPNYGYGTRREDQTPVIEASGLFGPVVHLDARVVHHQTRDECVEAWRSHATLQRQAGADFPAVVEAIANLLDERIMDRGIANDGIDIPYTTNIWMARRR